MSNAATTSNNPAVSTKIWKLAKEAIQKCANHPDTIDHVQILSSYLDNAKEIVSEAFLAGEIDEKTLNLIIQAESDWVDTRRNTIVVEEAQKLVKSMERLERRILESVEKEKGEEEAAENKGVVENGKVEITNPIGNEISNP